MDGHSGVSNEQVNEGSSGPFSFILTFLKDASGAGDFVIHASSNRLYGPSPHPLEFLQHIGLKNFRGNCPFHYDRCLYGSIARKEASHGMPDIWGTQRIHDGFKQFCAGIDELYNAVRKEREILADIGFEGTIPKVFGNPGKIIVDETEIPPWVEEVKFERLKQVEAELKEKEESANKLRQILPLLYSTGEDLEFTVVAALRVLGLEAERTEPGFTADILSWTPDRSLNFGLEVTGIAGQIKKDSKKLTQVIQFEMQKENEEKTILVASTYNQTPVSERPVENFTPQVIQFLGVHPILLMTGLDLYRIVSDVLDGRKQPEDQVQLLHSSEGVFTYEPE